MVRLAVERHVADLKDGHLRGLKFDEKKAAVACKFFPLVLRHSIGEWDGKPFRLSGWQSFIVWSLFGWVWIDTGYRRFRKALASVARKNGKGLALDTPIPTPDGWKTMGELQVGDTLFDENGLPCKVTLVSDVKHIDCYELQFSNGERIKCDGDHLWVTKARIPRPGRGRDNTPCPRVQVRNVRLIRDTLTAGSRGDLNHSLDMPAPLQCDAADLPIDPYVLGAWLGDGHTHSAELTCSVDDGEILQGLCDAGLVVTEKCAAAGKARTYSLKNDKGGKCSRGHEGEIVKGHCRACERLIDRANRRGLPLPERTNVSFREELRNAGVLNNKHIPAKYLRASFSQRLALMQGLMDTDGYINKNGKVINFDTTCEAIRDGVAELLATFGLKFTIIPRKMRCNRRDVPGTSYRFQFSCFSDLPVFRLGRKLQRMRNPPESQPRSRTLQITAVEPIETVPTVCIQVDSPSHQFLCGRRMIPTHNTVTVAGIANLLQFADNEAGAELYSVATKEDQAKLMFREAERQVNASPDLKKRALIRRAPASIQWPERNSFYKALGSDSKSTDGLNPHAVLIDEYHEWRETHRALKEKLSSGSGARRQPLEIIITTAGADHSQLWIEEDDYARAVLEGSAAGQVIDDTYFAFVARIDDDDDPLDEAVWPKANPNYGISVKPEYLRAQANEARHKPTAMNQFVRYHCNRRVASHERLIAPAVWEAGAKPLTVDSGADAFGGIDIGRSNDWCAIALAFPVFDGDKLIRHEIKSKAWCCKDGGFPADHEPYRGWIKRGLLTCHPGNSVDFAEVVRTVREWDEDYRVSSWALDPNFAKVVGQQLCDEGISVFEFKQSHAKYNEPIRTFVKDLDEGKIWHGADPVLTWQAGNLQVAQNSRGEWMPDKSNRESKIDGMVAVLMAFGESLFAQKKSTGSLYVV
jgi:phage terminase large subunit-like protein